MDNPSSCIHTLNKASDLVNGVFFFVFPRNLDIIIIIKLTAFFIFLCLPLLLKKLTATALTPKPCNASILVVNELIHIAQGFNFKYRVGINTIETFNVFEKYATDLPERSDLLFK